MQNSDKSYAIINGEAKEYDLCINSLDIIQKLDKDYEYIGHGHIGKVCGIAVQGKSMRHFFRKKAGCK